MDTNALMDHFRFTADHRTLAECYQQVNDARYDLRRATASLSDDGERATLYAEVCAELDRVCAEVGGAVMTLNDMVGSMNSEPLGNGFRSIYNERVYEVLSDVADTISQSTIPLTEDAAEHEGAPRELASALDDVLATLANLALAAYRITNLGPATTN